MGRMDQAVELWRDATAGPRYHVAVVRAIRSHERAVRRYQRRLVRLRHAVGTRAALAGGSGVTAGGLMVTDHGLSAAALFLTSIGLGWGSWRARQQVASAAPPPPPLLPVRPGSRAAAHLWRLDHLAYRRERLAALVDDAHAREALCAAAEAERLLRAATHRMAAIEETAGPMPDKATFVVVAGLDAEIVGGMESYDGVIARAVQLAGVVTAPRAAAAELDEAAAALEARTYGLRRLGELGLA